MTMEIVEDRALVHVAAIAHPLSMDRRLLDVEAGPTIADLLRLAGVPPWAHVRVHLDGDLVFPEFYHVVRPRRGSHIVIRAVPRGGGGGRGGNKNIGMLIVGILVIIIGIILLYTPLAAAGPYVIGAGISLTLAALINILIPPPVPPKLRPLSGLSAGESESPTLSIAGQRNTARPYGIVTRVIGRHKIFPAYAALPFTETVGGDQYLRLLFWIGLGVTEIDTLQIGETAIENFQNVELEIRTGAAGEPPITLYTQDVFEDPLSVSLTVAGGPQVRTSQDGAVELSVAIVFPQGLVLFSGAGAKSATTVSITAEYRLVGQAAWVPVPGSPVATTEARQAVVRAGIRWKPQRPAGPYGAASWAQFGFASVTLSRFNDGVLNVIAFDADAATAGAWVRVDTGAGTPKEFGRVVVTSAGTGANCTWDVQWSDDLVAWTTVFSGFSTGAAGTQSAEWATAGARRYWRLLKTNGAVAGPDYYEVEWWATTAGRYDVRLTRTTADAVNPNLLDLSVWGALRTFGADPPIAMPAGAAYAVVAMRIKATDQLNGIVDNFNCIASAKVLDYATYAGSVLADRPLGYWRLGEALAAPTAFDATGNGRSGTYRGAPVLATPGLVSGDADTAMKTTAVDAWVDSFVGLSAIDMGATSFTLELIFKTESIAAGTQVILTKGSGDVFTNGPVGWGVRRNAATIEVVRNAGGGAPTLATVGPIVVGTTYLLHVTYDRASGVLLARLDYNAATDTQNVGTASYADSYGLYIGRQASGSVFYGTLDEVAVYPSLLADARLQAHLAAKNGTREWVVQRTSNPASLYRTVLQDAGTARPVADARLDLAQLQAWHQECSSGGRSCNIVVDYKTTQNELLRVIAACGRATPTMNDGKYATVRDLAQTVPIQHFTPRNVRNFRGHRLLPEALHALKVRFIDPLASWQQSERIVYDDGYTAANATRFEVLELHGVTDPDMAWRIGRYHIAVARLRPEFYDFETDVEHLVARRGDMVRVAHDVTEWGLAQGRIKGLWLTLADDSLRGASFWSQSGLTAYTAAKVNDGDTATAAFDVNTSPVGSWLQIDAGAPIDYGGVTLYFSAGRQMGWAAQFSDDAVNWQTVAEFTDGPGVGISFVRTWYSRGAHRYWRLLKTAEGSPQTQHYREIQWQVGAAPALQMVMDEELPMVGGQNYAVRLRLADGTSTVATLVTVAGNQTTVAFAPPLGGPLPAAGDLVMFGLVNQESVAAIVSRIVPGPEFSAVLTLVDAAPAVLTADQGAIPPWDPQMTRQAPIELIPPTPLVTSVVSDETVLIRDLDGSLISRIVVALEYVASSNVRADYVEARYRRAGSGAPFDPLPRLPPDAPIVSVVGVEDRVAYDVRVRSVNRDGPTSPWVEVLNHTVVGKTSAPTAPVNLRLEGARLAWDYPIAPLDFDGFEVRRSPGGTGNWQTALEMHVGLVFSPFDLPTIYQQWTFLVAAIDTSGNASAPASLTVDFGNPLLHNTVASKDYDADGYPGSITNGSVSAGDLKADQLTTGFWTQDGNLFWSASGATLFWQGTYKQMTYDFSYTTGSNAAGAAIVFSVVTIVAVAWSLAYRVGASGAYLPWPGKLPDVLASQEYDFRLITAAGVVQGVVSGLTLVVDAEDLTEPIQNFATAVTTGTRLTLAKTYRSIKKVEVSVLASGAETAITAIAADQQNTAGAGNGPLIKSFDAAGAVVAGHVNGEITGY